MAAALFALSGPASSIPAQAPAEKLGLIVRVDGIRGSDGLLRLCLTSSSRNFPDCKQQGVREISVSTKDGGAIAVGGLKPGDYAIAVIHDENANGRLDMFLKMPREGFGFSNNPSILGGKPSFAKASFTLRDDGQVEAIRMRYIL